MELIFTINSVIVWFVIIFNLLLTITIIRKINNKPEYEIPTLELGQRAPDFTADTLAGKSITRADLAGRKTAIVFVSADCGYCRTEIPIIESVKAGAQRSGVDILFVSTSNKELTQSFVDELKITLPIVIAPRAINTFAASYYAGGTPFYCLIDEEGIVEKTGIFDHDPWKELIAVWKENNKIEPHQ